MPVFGRCVSSNVLHRTCAGPVRALQNMFFAWRDFLRWAYAHGQVRLESLGSGLCALGLSAGLFAGKKELDWLKDPEAREDRAKDPESSEPEIYSTGPLTSSGSKKIKLRFLES